MPDTTWIPTDGHPDPHLEGDAKIARMGWRGRLDLWGNDYYLAHIHNTMRRFTRPSHTVILGDHMSSQWIDDVEFAQRSMRLEDRILRWGPDDQRFNITGNHDVGYAGDMTQFRINRWTQRFGPTNFLSYIETGLSAPNAQSIRIVGLNDLHLDGPALDENLRGQTHLFLQQIPQTNETTILLTHIPMHKETGLCIDGPHMSYYEYPRVLLREQNHLSPESTKAVLEQVFNGDGFVLSGHDHEGCHVTHLAPAVPSGYWTAKKYDAAGKVSGQQDTRKTVEEATVRSVMGQYSGNAGLLTARYDLGSSRWIFKYQGVAFVHNTVWWLVNILTLISGVYLAAYVMVGRRGLASLRRIRSKRRRYVPSPVSTTANIILTPRRLKKVRVL